MSQKSFAAVSVATAVICGVFFYPPAPQSRTKPALPIKSAPAATASVRPAAAIWIQTPLQGNRNQATLHRVGMLNAPRPMAPLVDSKGNAS